MTRDDGSELRVKRVHPKLLVQTAVSLSLSTNLQSEISPDISEYLKLIDHGGLKLPTLFTVDLCTCTFLLFQLILEKVEDELLPHSNQRAFLMSCVAAYHSSELDFEEMCSACKLSLGQLVKMCFRIMCNILLNNYCKVKRNSILVQKASKKRKLSTLS